MADNATTTSTKAKAGNIKTAKDNAKKPSDVKTDVPKSTAKADASSGAATTETDIEGANPPEATGTSGATVGKSPTAPDEVTENAKLGGSTVEKIKAGDGGKGAKHGDITVQPDNNRGGMLVGNTYTLTVPVEPGDTVTFLHPSGREVQASVSAGMASGTFLIERPGDISAGFKINGRKITNEYGTRSS